MNEPLLGEKENEITDAVTKKTVDDLQEIASDHGIPAMVATAFGMSFAIAHIFKHLGLRAIYKDLQHNLTSFIRRPSGG